MTILVAPLMSCSARLPVYALMIGAFIPNRRVLGIVHACPGLTMIAMYFLGTVAAFAMAWLFKRTLLKGAPPRFLHGDAALPAAVACETVLIQMSSEPGCS